MVFHVNNIKIINKMLCIFYTKSLKFVYFIILE